MRGMNIKRGGLVFDESIDRYWESSQGLEKYLLDAGDIVISMDGSLVGKSFGTVAKSDLPLLLVQRVASGMYTITFPVSSHTMLN